VGEEPGERAKGNVIGRCVRPGSLGPRQSPSLCTRGGSLFHVFLLVLLPSSTRGCAGASRGCLRNFTLCDARARAHVPVPLLWSNPDRTWAQGSPTLVCPPRRWRWRSSVKGRRPTARSTPSRLPGSPLTTTRCGALAHHGAGPCFVRFVTLSVLSQVDTRMALPFPPYPYVPPVPPAPGAENCVGRSILGAVGGADA
jgi:hypothetical protein